VKALFKGKRLILFVGLLVFLVGVNAVAFLVTDGFRKPIVLQVNVADPNAGTAAAAAPPTEPTPQQAEAQAKEQERGILVDLGTKVVNLADPGGYRYLKVGLVVEILPEDPAFKALQGEARAAEEEKLSAEITDRRAIIDDAMIGMLSDSTFSEIFTLAGKDALKQELRDRINERLGSELVTQIYFTEFIIQ
jgi:flagellar protein FliL